MTKLHMLYTLEEGGNFNYVAYPDDEMTRKLFEDTKKNKLLNLRMGDKIIKQKPCYIALVEETDNYDFILDRKR